MLQKGKKQKKDLLATWAWSALSRWCALYQYPPSPLPHFSYMYLQSCNPCQRNSVAARRIWKFSSVLISHLNYHLSHLCTKSSSNVGLKRAFTILAKVRCLTVIMRAVGDESRIRLDPVLTFFVLRLSDNRFFLSNLSRPLD